jgi:GTP-binding protein HflX
VVDAGSPDAPMQIEAVRTVLDEIDASEVPELLVLNKADVADPVDVKVLLGAHPGAVVVSGVTGAGTDVLLGTIAARLRALAPIVELEVPYERGDVVAALHREGEVLVEVHAEGGSRLRARLPAPAVTRFEDFVVDRS